MHRLRRRRHRKRLRSNKRHGVLGFCPARTALRRCRITYRVIRISWIVTCHILLHRFIIVNAVHCASTSLNYHNIHNHSCNPINVYQHALFIGITYPHLGRIITHSREFDSYQGDREGRKGRPYSTTLLLLPLAVALVIIIVTRPISHFSPWRVTRLVSPAYLPLPPPRHRSSSNPHQRCQLARQ